MSLLRSARLWIAVFSLAAVMLFAVNSIERTSPGELTMVHGRETSLAGGRSCSECHGGWFSTMTQSCLECHEPIADQLESGAGLHGYVGKERGAACAMCHSEHHGAGFAIVNRQSFALAGVPDPDEFDHALIGFRMEGEHLSLDCQECHTYARDAVLPAGQHRFLGLDQDCATCHEDGHAGRMVLDCADCHGQTSFLELQPRDHDEHLPLTGGHAELDCSACHQSGSAHSLDALGEGRGGSARRCADCHDSPHDRRFVDRVATQRAARFEASCTYCHEPDHTSFRDEKLELDATTHALTGFALDAPHDDVACAECHRDDLGDFAARHPGRRQDDCRACHLDPHGGQFDAGRHGSKDCLDCHDRTRFEPHAFSAAAHASTGFQLTGAHLDADCHACHVRQTESSPRTFRSTPGRCEDCHADAHLGVFDALLADGGVPDAGTCARCHGTVGFRDGADTAFDHAHWTGFAIGGAHAQAGCEACHPRGPEPDRFGRTFGRVAEHFGQFLGCVTCHADPHRGRFDEVGLPATVDGRAGCARCHVETSFRILTDAFDHGAWTGHPLVGAHRDARCTACHAPLRRPDPDGRTTMPARGRRCDDCHDDPHGAQFEADGRTECSRCHTATAIRFAEPVFDHDTQSRFPLGEAHAAVPCSACHKPFDHDGRRIVRYRPLKRECADCHGTIRDPLRRGEGRRR